MIFPIVGLAIGVALAAVAARGAGRWWRDARLLIGAALFLLGGFGIQAGTGRLWPRGPSIGEGTQAWLLLTGLLAVFAGSAVLVAAALRSRART